jgi:NTP pyrophosphatase (non-canonical NTP hydrolase)
MKEVCSAQKDEIRPEVMAFAHVMEERLRRNDYKGGWKNCKSDYLIKRLCEEYLELRDAIREKGMWGPWVRGEAADVANFAMMIWDLAMIAENGEERE